MVTLRHFFLYAPVVLAGTALLAIAAGAAQVRGSAASQPTPVSVNPVRGPAPTLTAPATPSKALGANGFIQRWLLEPIPAAGLTDSIVQVSQEGVLPQPAHRPSEGRGQGDRWRHGTCLARL
jgi:hypothetical protein